MFAHGQNGALGNFPQSIPGAYGAGQSYVPPGLAMLTSGISDDAEYNKRLLEAANLLGPPPRLNEADPRNRFPREITLLPELWSGPDGTMISNPYLTESMVFFEDEQMRGIISRMAPPVLFRGNPTLKLKVLYFNRAKVDQYTHTGTPRLVTKTLDQWDAAIARVGLGAEFDEEMIGTKEGTELIRQSIKQIQIAILDHCGIDCLLALLHARAQPTNFYSAQQLPVPSALAYDAMEDELEHWSCLTKNEFGLAKLCTFARKQIKQQQGAEPDTIIMPPDVADYLRFSRPELTDYSRQGSKGVDRQEAGGNAVMAPQLGGLTVLAAPLIPGIDQGPPQDALRHLRMIGEMFFMDADWNNHVPGVQLSFYGGPAANNGTIDYAMRNTEIQVAGVADRLNQIKLARTIYVHDNLSDTMQPVSIKKIQDFFAAQIAEIQANPAVAQAFAVNFGGVYGMMERFANQQAYSPTANPPSPYDEYGWYDFHVLLLRPKMLYSTSCFIFAKSGRETAETHVGFGDARWGRDATRKKALFHYTTYAGCVVKRPQNVYVANCARIEKYLMGGGVVLGQDIFPVLVPREGALGYNVDDISKARNAAFLGTTADAFTGVIDNQDDFILSTVPAWQTFYNFQRNADGAMLFNNYKAHQEHNCRVFRGPCEYARVNEQGQITDPRGNHILGKGHWGHYAYDGVGAARLGKGPKPYVVDPYCH